MSKLLPELVVLGHYPGRASETKEDFEVADFDPGDLERIGLEIVTYVNTNRGFVRCPICIRGLGIFNI